MNLYELAVAKALSGSGGGGGGEEYAALIDRSITSANIPSGVEKIGTYAFYACSHLQSVTIPNSVTRIDEYAFMGCSSLESLVIPEGVTYIGKNSTSACTALSSIDYPSTINGIGAGSLNQCTSLMSVTSRRTSPPSISAAFFNSVPATCAIYVPAESVSSYKTATGWSTRADYIQAIQ